MAFLDNDGVTRLTGDYLDIFARKEDAVLDPSGGLIRTDDGIRVDSLVQESEGEVSGAIAEVTAKGHAEQFTTTGKNLLPNNIVSETRNGITFTVNADGSISVKGTSSETSRSSCRINLPLTQGTYTLGKWVTSMTNQNVNAAILVLGDTSKTRIATLINNSTITFTVDTSVTYTEFAIYVPASTTVDAIFYPQVELGSTATAYEPYTGGAPSPSPDYPQEIQVVRGRNLLDYPDFVNSSSSKTRKVNTTHFWLDAGIYTLSKSHDDADCQANLYKNPGNVLFVNIPSGTQSGTFTIDERTEFTGIELDVPANSTRNLQIELGSTAHPYVPYGHVGMEVQGKNLLDTSSYTESGKYVKNDGTLANDGDFYVSRYIKIDGGEDYYLSGSVNANAPSICFYDASLGFLSGTSFVNRTAFKVTAPQNAAYARISYSPLALQTQFEKGSTATEYKPYIGSTTPIPLPSRGWVAGLPDGTADTLTLDGAGKVEWTKQTGMDTFDGSVKGSSGVLTSYGVGGEFTRHTLFLPQDAVIPSNYSLNFMANRLVSDAYTTVTGSATLGEALIYPMSSGTRCAVLAVLGGELSTTGLANTWLSTHPVNVLYPLATPIIEHVGYVDMPAIPSNATVTIPELDALGIKYFVDDSVTGYGREIIARGQYDLSETNEEIDTLEASIAPVESAVATSNHAVGDYFMLGNVLMRTTTAIASGEKITTSNATPATVQSQIDALRDSLGQTLYYSGNVSITSNNQNVTNLKSVTGLTGTWIAVSTITAREAIPGCQNRLSFDGHTVINVKDLANSTNIQAVGICSNGTVSLHTYTSSTDPKNIDWYLDLIRIK